MTNTGLIDETTTLKKTITELAAVLGAILQMSDHAQSLGAAGSISGVAALHKMQTSIQKNSKRIAPLIVAAIGKDAA